MTVRVAVGSSFCSSYHSARRSRLSRPICLLVQPQSGGGGGIFHCYSFRNGKRASLGGYPSKGRSDAAYGCLCDETARRRSAPSASGTEHLAGANGLLGRKAWLRMRTRRHIANAKAPAAVLAGAIPLMHKTFKALTALVLAFALALPAEGLSAIQAHAATGTIDIPGKPDIHSELVQIGDVAQDDTDMLAVSPEIHSEAVEVEQQEPELESRTLNYTMLATLDGQNARETVLRPAAFYAQNPFTSELVSLGLGNIQFENRAGAYYISAISGVKAPPEYKGHAFNSYQSKCTTTGTHVMVTDSSLAFTPSNVACNPGAEGDAIEIIAQYDITGCWITYNSNGGSSYTVEHQMAIKGEATPVPPSTPSHGAGMKFMGWYDSPSGGTQYANEKNQSSRNWDKNGNAAILYAHWGTQVTFNSNGGNAFSYSAYAVAGEAMPVPKSIPSKSGAFFSGWYDDAPAGRGTRYIDDTNKATRNFDKQNVKTVTMYAHWGVVITFNANGGSLSGSNTRVVEAGTATLCPASKPTKSGYSFIGWFDSASGGTMYVNANQKSVRNWGSGSGTLFAQYANVFYDSSGGSPSYDAMNAVSGEPTPKPSNYGSGPTLGSCNLEGWFDAKTGGTKYLNADGTSAKNWDKTAATTLYAQWSGMTVVYSSNGGSPAGGSETVTLGLPTPSPGFIPEAPGFTLQGWYDAPQRGNKYLNADGTSVRNWDKSQEVSTLYAQWKRDSGGANVDITFKADSNDGDITFKVDNSTNDYSQHTVTFTTGTGKTVNIKPSGDHLFIYGYKVPASISENGDINYSKYERYADHVSGLSLNLDDIVNASSSSLQGSAILNYTVILQETFALDYNGKEPTFDEGEFYKIRDVHFIAQNPLTGGTICDRKFRIYASHRDRNPRFMYDLDNGRITDKAPALPSITLDGQVSRFRGWLIELHFVAGYGILFDADGIRQGTRGVPNVDKNLYAVYEPVYTYDVNLGGMSSDIATSFFPKRIGNLDSGSSVIQSGIALSDVDDYWSRIQDAQSRANVVNSFITGWFTSRSGGTKVLDSSGRMVSQIENTSGVGTLYAQWTEGYRNIIYKADGKGISSDKTVVIDIGESFSSATVTLLNANSATYNGKKVIAWFDKDPYSASDPYIVGLPGSTIKLTDCSNEFWALYSDKDK